MCDGVGRYYKNLGSASDKTKCMAAIDLLLVDVQSSKGRTFHLKIKSGGSDVVLKAESDKAAAK